MIRSKNKFYLIGSNLTAVTLLSISAVLVGTSAAAENKPAENKSDRICDNLYKLTCAVGEYPDGTGSAENPDVFNSKAEKVAIKALQAAKDTARKKLADPNSTYFRELALSATGLSVHPDCEESENENKVSDKCLDLLAEGTARISLEITTEQLRFPTTHSGKTSLKDKVLLATSKDFKAVTEAALATFREGLHVKEVGKLVEDKLFPKVKAILVKKIEEMVVDPKIRKLLASKVAAITFSGADCSKTDTGLSDPLLSNAFYNPLFNTFQYCAGLALDNGSEFHLAYVIAHELTHSIDPCGIAVGPSDYVFNYKRDATRKEAENEFPFYGVVPCLRTKDSTFAKSAADFKSCEPAAKADEQELDGKGQENCLEDPPPPIEGDDFDSKKLLGGFCQGDQITEAFADWMASDVVPDYIAENHKNLNTRETRFGYSNALRGLCTTEGEAFQGHSFLERRANNVLLANPKVRSQMKCPPEPAVGKYCKALKVKPSEGPGYNQAPSGKFGIKIYGQPNKYQGQPQQAPQQPNTNSPGGEAK